jgi:predicted Zn finger-like uncharacterized protein
MKIQCQSCQAKYTIADEKVLGKVVKIRCKKCSSTIVINGNEARGGDDNAETHVFDYGAQGSEQWTVNIADGDQRTMTTQEIIAEYRAGTVHDETFCWKETMADWLPLREIEQLYGAIKLGRGGADFEHEEVPMAPHSAPSAAGSNLAGLFSADENAAAVESPRYGANGSNGANGHAYAREAAAPAPAARRGGGRGQGADLFGNVATAGAEEDVISSATGGSPSNRGGLAASSAGLDEQKLTGQRNESSVLFSLSALTEGGKAEASPAANRTTASGDGSGLIDIRALSQSMGSDDKRGTNARVDDIMNLTGGGAFGAALAAPILAPPPIELSHDYGQNGNAKSNTVLIAAIVGGALLIAIGIVVAVVLTRPSAPAPDANTERQGRDAPNTTTGSGESPDPAVVAAATAAASGADNTPPPPGTGNANAKAPPVTGQPAPKAPAFAAAKEPAPAPAAPKAPEPPKDLAGALAEAAGKPKEAPAPAAGAGGGTAPFDRGTASAAIGAVNVQSCKKDGGPTGAGHVKITFAPNGTVSAAVIDSGPFAGTPVGGCIVGKFRGPHVPPFSGGSITVGKSFTIN